MTAFLSKYKISSVLEISKRNKCCAESEGKAAVDAKNLSGYEL